jgi:hypothetical protein
MTLGSLQSLVAVVLILPFAASTPIWSQKKEGIKGPSPVDWV